MSGIPLNFDRVELGRPGPFGASEVFQQAAKLRNESMRVPDIGNDRTPSWKPSESVDTPQSGDEAPQGSDEAMEHVRGLLRFIGEDPEREGLRETPARVVRSMVEHFRGYAEDPTEHLKRTFSDVKGYDELVLVSDIELHSHCEHHMVPFVGRAHVAYLPKGRIVGLSKIARVVDVFSKRLQVQEKLTIEIADAIWTALEPSGVAVILQCQHFCMCYRGVKKPGSWTTTSKLHGCFLENDASRLELLTLIGIEKGIG